MQTSLALVHHANQYLITNGYDNREGIDAVVGAERGESGFFHVLRLHEEYRIPLNLHLSGTLIEAIAWHRPEFLQYVRELLATGLVELVGSSYGQNIMRFFSAEYNRDQLNEELYLYREHLRVDPLTVKAFWPPERVWETRRMAPVLRDAKLLNDGYRYVILDDRLLLAHDDPTLPRGQFDQHKPWDPSLFRMHEIEDGLGLIAFPIATRLRRSIPPQANEDWSLVQSDLEGLLVHKAEAGDEPLLAIYADDMEKVAGIGEWGGSGPARYRAFLEWLQANTWIAPALLTSYASNEATPEKRKIEAGTFLELATEFEAGEAYERWYLAPDWAPYRGYFNWADTRVKEAQKDGGDPALLELARKQLLVANWETAWHTPASGPHGDANQHGHASPWARALTSHSRHAAVTAEAARWMTSKDKHAHAVRMDIDNDGEEEIVLRNQHLFVVVSPRWGGRVVAMFSVSGAAGTMVIGNPCDDWNWQEELNRYMSVPRNHPGALADAGHENDSYRAEIIETGGARAGVTLTNIEDSRARGLVKQIELSDRSSSLFVRYSLPAELPRVDVEFGLSPDYLHLLRCGANILKPIRTPSMRGYKTDRVAVWIKPQPGGQLAWGEPAQELFGHGRTLRLGSAARQFALAIGITARRSGARSPRSAADMVTAT